MKKRYFFAAACLLMLAACTKTNDPVTVAQEFVDAVNTFRFDDARKIVTPAFLPTFARIEGEGNFMQEQRKREHIANFSESKPFYTLEHKDEQSATVAVGFKGKNTNDVVMLYLKKIDDKWLVDQQENK